MVVEARLRVHHVDSLAARVGEGTRVLHLSGDHSHCLAVMEGRDAQDVETLLDTFSGVIEPGGVLDRSDTGALVRCACMRRAPILAAIEALGCSVIWPIVYADHRKHYTVIAPDRDRLRSLLARLRDFGDVDVVSVADVQGDSIHASVNVGDVTTALSAKQLAALRLAIQAGYYESPRRVRAEALAHAFGISRSTYQEHLRKAEERVLGFFAGVLASHPGLLEGAGRKPGRPPGRSAGRRNGATKRQPQDTLRVSTPR